MIGEWLAATNLLEEVRDQLRDVLAALAQRRHRDLDHVQPVIEVFAERALRDHVAQVAVRGADDADVDVAGAAVGADALDFAGLEEAQQQALHAQRHLADFVEEHRAHVRRLELAGLVAIGAGEAALDVAEQLRLEQRLGQAGAVDRRERHVGARAVVVNGARDDLLADAAFAADQDLRVAARHAIDLRLQRRHRLAAPDQADVLLGARAPCLRRWG